MKPARILHLKCYSLPERAQGDGISVQRLRSTVKSILFSIRLQLTSQRGAYFWLMLVLRVSELIQKSLGTRHGVNHP